ncbi:MULTISPECIES: feruloyl-CoA synthase [Rhizobium]|uniref:feruloyl-CoA synthase n=1 Tax=Rhizobium TaxID=379 RepID=UPI001C834715|nr:MULTISPECIES: feruloyl-CoA synthase [Rhizobium]MBX4899677.1 feruloyl-CoA synthase [Rhizobium bangladeshense]MBX5297526.1 feruloyl-CoA synthase [Rhizobium sp. NLR15a]MBY3617870.1 feruloyl-CoA synthase [Rhizobium bangladeshense]
MQKLDPRYRPAIFSHDNMHAVWREDGCVLVRSGIPLQPYPQCLSDRLLHWAEHAPGSTFVAKRNADGAWRRISYGATLACARRIGQGLLDRGLSADRPVAILSGNDLEHALLACACLYAGVPYAPVSPAYSLVAASFERLRHVALTLTPGLVFVSDARIFSRALDAVFPNVEVVATQNTGVNRPVTSFEALAETNATAAIDAAQGAINGDTIAKFLFTSGSTSMPKAVINTHRMLCANMQMLRQTWPFIAEEPPVLVDWLPWHHTFGGNQNLGLTMYNGGELYIDEGRPTPEGIAATLANLREVSPTIYLNVPRGWDEISSALTQDETLRNAYFRRLRMQFFAGASLAQPVWDRLNQIAEQHCDERIVMNTGLGMTETAPTALLVVQNEAHAGQIGLPVPGMELKLVPCTNDGYQKLEARYRGPNVTPGYWRAEEQTRKVFDDEGYFCSGDAVKWLNPDRPSLGLVFDGRITEDFKLDSGTWISLGAIREAARAAGAPYIQDVVAVGPDRKELALLLVPNIEECRRLADANASLSREGVLAHPSVRAFLQTVLDVVNSKATGSASRVARALVLEAPLSLDKGEITEKGSVNQRVVLTEHLELIEALYSGKVPNILFPTSSRN